MSAASRTSASHTSASRGGRFPFGWERFRSASRTGRFPFGWERFRSQSLSYYWVRVATSIGLAIATALLGAMGAFVWMAMSLCLLVLSLWWQLKLYQQHTRQVLFMIDALENNDNTFHFSEEGGTPESRQVNQALNRVKQILYHVKAETAQQEKYYELILDCIGTGLLVLNDSGAIYQKNSEALRLLGLAVFTHIRQLERVDTTLMHKLSACVSGDKLQISFNNERGTINLFVRVSDITVRKEHLRILTLNDINTELDEREIDSWIRLTRVLTHEIMNSVTPIASLSETLLSLPGNKDEETRRGLQTISTTGRGLLSFVESYRRFTRIPTPEPSLFYVQPFIDRMVELAQHPNVCPHIRFTVDISPCDLILHADENLISQVVINLLKNAIQAIGTQPDATIALRATCNEAEEVWIEVKNNGPAIPPEVAEHIFIPFFTTKEGGSGIGLSISRQIMRLSGGSLTLLPDRETRFVLKFK